MARTAVIAGTATAVSGAVYNHQQDKRMNKQQEQAATQEAFAAQAELEQLKAQQAAAAAPPPAAAAGAPDVTAELMKLADLKEKGILTDAEFAAAKAKLLA
jgi:hypothetical protein